MGIFGIALAAAFSTTTRAFIPALFALSALLTAEIAWQVIRIFRTKT